MSTFENPNFYLGMQETFSKVITEGEAALFAGLVGVNSPRVVEEVDSATSETQHRVYTLLMVGIIGGLLSTRLPGAGSQCVNINYEFLAPIKCGDRIETTLELVGFDPHKRLATYKANCFDQSKNQVITGQAVMLVEA